MFLTNTDGPDCVPGIELSLAGRASEPQSKMLYLERSASLASFDSARRDTCRLMSYLAFIEIEESSFNCFLTFSITEGTYLNLRMNLKATFFPWMHV